MTTTPKIVGLVGKFNTGKNTAADIFRNQGFTNIAFADPLKYILRDHFEVPDIELWGPSEKRSERTRQMLQHLGTDFGRKFDPDIWIKQLKKRLEKYVEYHIKAQSINPGFVITDVRFPNEAKMIVKELNGTLIKIIRPDNNIYQNQNLKEHESETSVDAIPEDLIAITINNSAKLADFYSDIHAAIKVILA